MAVTPPPWPKTTAKPSLGMTTWLHPPVHINIPTSAQSQSVIGQSHKPECHAMLTLISSLSQACLGKSACSHECSCLIVLSCVVQGGVPGPPRPSCTTCLTPTVMFPDAASIAVRLPLLPPHQMLPPPSCRNNISVLNISYLCPEPVLANTRFCVCFEAWLQKLFRAKRSAAGAPESPISLPNCREFKRHFACIDKKRTSFHRHHHAV